MLFKKIIKGVILIMAIIIPQSHIKEVRINKIVDNQIRGIEVKENQLIIKNTKLTDPYSNYVIWKAITVNPTTGRYVAVGNKNDVITPDKIIPLGYTAYSDDGINFTIGNEIEDADFFAITVNPTTGRYVALSSTIRNSTPTIQIAYSDDGINFTKSNYLRLGFKAITVNPTTGRYVAVGYENYVGYIAYSDDGINFTETSTFDRFRFYDITVNPTTGRYVAVGTTNLPTSNHCVFYSDNGINFTRGNIDDVLSGRLETITVNPTTGRYVALGSTISSPTSNYTAYSDDGINFTRGTVAFTGKAITVNPTTGRYVATAFLDNMYYSDDGINFIGIFRTSSYDFITVNPTTGRYVALAPLGNLCNSDTGKSFYDKAIDNQIENIKIYPSNAEETNFILETNELLQAETTYQGIPIAQYNAQNLLNTRKNGLKTAEIRVCVLDYYDTNGNKVIDVDSDKSLFDIADTVIPYIAHNKPLSTYPNGQPMQWRVTSNMFSYNGIGNQKLQLLEIPQQLL